MKVLENRNNQGKGESGGIRIILSNGDSFRIKEEHGEMEIMKIEGNTSGRISIVPHTANVILVR
jgi:hypothetical protein